MTLISTDDQLQMFLERMAREVVVLAPSVAIWPIAEREYTTRRTESGFDHQGPDGELIVNGGTWQDVRFKLIALKLQLS